MQRHLHDRVFINADLYERWNEVESNGGAWWAAIMTDNAGVQGIKKGHMVPDPDEMRSMFARDLCFALNRNLHHDGVWSVGWVNLKMSPVVVEPPHYTQLIILWMDGDGDVRFPIESERPIADMMLEGMNYWLDVCEQGYQRWHHHMVEVLDPTEKDHYRKALGEKPHTRTPEMIAGIDDVDEKGQRL